MTPTIVTEIATLVVAVLSSIIIPNRIRRRNDARKLAKDEAKERADESASFKDFTTALNVELKRVTAELRESETARARDRAELEAQHKVELDACHARIRTLEQKVNDLYAELYEGRRRPPDR